MIELEKPTEIIKMTSAEFVKRAEGMFELEISDIAYVRLGELIDDTYFEMDDDLSVKIVNYAKSMLLGRKRKEYDVESDSFKNFYTIAKVKGTDDAHEALLWQRAKHIAWCYDNKDRMDKCTTEQICEHFGDAMNYFIIEYLMFGKVSKWNRPVESED